MPARYARKEHTISPTTPHNPNCHRAFRNYDLTCPRCAELKTGSLPRKGWNSFRETMNAQFLRELRSHDCKTSRCLSICTAFDY
jgi:hypothetical protein